MFCLEVRLWNIRTWDWTWSPTEFKSPEFKWLCCAVRCCTHYAEESAINHTLFMSKLSTRLLYFHACSLGGFSTEELNHPLRVNGKWSALVMFPNLVQATGSSDARLLITSHSCQRSDGRVSIKLFPRHRPELTWIGSTSNRNLHTKSSMQ